MFTQDTNWQKIFQANIVAAGFEMDDILYGGPECIKKCAGKLTNSFWKETLGIFSKIQVDVIYHRPDLFFNFGIFDNNLFKMANEILKRSDFRK